MPTNTSTFGLYPGCPIMAAFASVRLLVTCSLFAVPSPLHYCVSNPRLVLLKRLLGAPELALVSTAALSWRFGTITDGGLPGPSLQCRVIVSPLPALRTSSTPSARHVIPDLAPLFTLPMSGLLPRRPRRQLRLASRQRQELPRSLGFRTRRSNSELSGCLQRPTCGHDQSRQGRPLSRRGYTVLCL